MKKIFLSFIAIFLTSFSLQSLASLSISPLKYEFEINQKNSLTQKIKVTNTDDTPITLYSSKEDFVAGDDAWNPKFIKPQDQLHWEFSLSNWIQVEDQNITLAPKESREVTFHIAVPANAEPGGHYGAIFFSPGTPSGVWSPVVQRLGVLILVNVPWEIQVVWEVKSFQIWVKTNQIFEAKKSFQDFPITFEAVFENTGNVHLKPTGKITLIDEDGEILKNIGKEIVASPAGAYIWEKMVDYIPINDAAWNVLPQSERRFSTDWQWFGYQVLNDDGTKSVLFKTLDEYYADQASQKAQFLMPWQKINTRTVQKNLTANFELTYEGKDTQKKEFLDSQTFIVTYHEKYIGINFALLTIWGLVLIGVFFYTIKVAPKRRAQQLEILKQKLKKELEEEK